MSNKKSNSTSDYERKEVFEYFYNCLCNEEAARALVNKMTDAEVAKLFDTLPEEGDEGE